MILLALACAGATESAAPDPCAEVPVVTWANFGEAFVTHECQGCHASTATERYGAPEDVSFDTVEQVWAQADLVLLVAAGETPTMPPRGGVEEDDQQRLRWWLECAEPGT